MNNPDACRICLGLGSDDDCDMQLIVKDFPEESVIIQKIELCGGIKVEIRDDLPNKICGECFFALNISYDFRKLCQSNDLKLRNIYAEEKLEIKDEPISDRTSLLVTPETVFLTEENSNDSSTFNEPEPEIKEEDDIKDLLKLEDLKKSTKDENIKEPVKRTKLKKTKKEKVFQTPKAPKVKELQICELCGNIYKRPSHLMLHMRRHAAEKPYSCEICMKKFTCQSEINRHMRVHTGVRPFKCKYCDRTFTDRSTNIKHERTHTNERPFECTTCGKAFTYSNVLKNHMLTHTGEKKFRCEICNKTFSRTHQLKQHLMTIIHQQREAKVNLTNNGEEPSSNIQTDQNLQDIGTDIKVIHQPTEVLINIPIHRI